MIKIALTGGIATGKSYVLDWFRRHGVECLDADELAHGVVAAGTEASQAIASRFGADILDASGAVDRRKLGPIVFADSTARRELEAIVHPAVYRAIQAGFRAFERLGVALAIADIPLLFETGRQRDFDRVIATVCPWPLQVARLVERGLSRDEAERRIAAQMPADEKASRADYVIRTDGTLADTDAQTEQIVKSLNPEILRSKS
jgi:dephospho-CoA kinase